MSEYKRKFTNSEKRHKLAKFNSVYYEGDPENWKVSRLPNWMNFYGYELDKELQGKSPKYYRQFKQGTIVMIDYGVPIGNELGGRHFGVVLSNNDTKFKRKIMVVPLSSHYHRGYIDLGYDLMQGITKLIQDRVIELNNTVNGLSDRLTQFKEANNGKIFTFTVEEIKFIYDSNIDGTLMFKEENSFNIEKRDPNFEKLIQQIKATNSWEKYPNIFKYVSFFDTIFSFQKEIFKGIDFGNQMVVQLNELLDKFKKYNKQSFAIISDVKTVSKLKVAKLSHYTISGNTYISEKALAKIKKEIIKTIE